MDFHKIVIIEPKNGMPLGCQIFFDDIKVKGLINYSYNVKMRESKTLIVEIRVEDIEIKLGED